MKRFVDDGRRLSAFAQGILVRCPRCEKAAIIACDWPNRQVALTCPQCGFSKSKQLLSWRVDYSASDPYFEQPLWIQTRCCSSTLWAYNWAHLAALREFVEANERVQSIRSSRSYFNALPRWLGARGNRRAILAAIDRLWRGR